MLSFSFPPLPPPSGMLANEKAPVALRRVAGTASVLASLCVGASFLAPRSVLARRSRRFVRSSAVGRSLRSLFSARYATQKKYARSVIARCGQPYGLTSLRSTALPRLRAPPLLRSSLCAVACRCVSPPSLFAAALSPPPPLSRPPAVPRAVPARLVYAPPYGRRGRGAAYGHP